MSCTISIVVPVQNGEGFLDRIIKMFISQTERNWEMNIVNDGSFDGTEKIVAQYGRTDPRIRHVALSGDKSLTTWLCACSGAVPAQFVRDMYIHYGFMDTVFENMVIRLEAKPRVDVVHCPITHMFPNGIMTQNIFLLRKCFKDSIACKYFPTDDTRYWMFVTHNYTSRYLHDTSYDSFGLASRAKNLITDMRKLYVLGKYAEAGRRWREAFRCDPPPSHNDFVPPTHMQRPAGRSCYPDVVVYSENNGVCAESVLEQKTRQQKCSIKMNARNTNKRNNPVILFQFTNEQFQHENEKGVV